jgi:hypothetical protein
LEAIDLILKQGSKQIGNWKVTPSDFFKALDMKYKLTQGSVFDGFMEALTAAEDDLEEDEDSEGMAEDGEGPDVLREASSEQSTPSGSGEVA